MEAKDVKRGAVCRHKDSFISRFKGRVCIIEIAYDKFAGSFCRFKNGKYWGFKYCSLVSLNFIGHDDPITYINIL